MELNHLLAKKLGIVSTFRERSRFTMKVKKGYLFILEGPDGVGKTTLTNKIFDRLKGKGFSVVKLSFPGKQAGSLGSLIYKIHHNPEAFDLHNIFPPSLQIMHIAAHAEAIYSKIIPAIESKKIVILDRFWWSTMVYGRVSGIDEGILESMIDLESRFWKEIKPDILFLLDRAESLDKSENPVRWQEIRAGYSQLRKEEKNKYPIYKITNDQTIELAQEQILHHILKVLEDAT